MTEMPLDEAMAFCERVLGEMTEDIRRMSPEQLITALRGTDWYKNQQKFIEDFHREGMAEIAAFLAEARRSR